MMNVNSARDNIMNRRFRPFYVASLAVMLVGLYGTVVIPKAHVANAISSISSKSVTTSALDTLEWLGPREPSADGLLNLTSSLSVLPFSFDN